MAPSLSQSLSNKLFILMIFFESFIFNNYKFFRKSLSNFFIWQCQKCSHQFTTYIFFDIFKFNSTSFCAFYQYLLVFLFMNQTVIFQNLSSFNIYSHCCFYSFSHFCVSLRLIFDKLIFNI